jgi:hypothetical protein
VSPTSLALIGRALVDLGARGWRQRAEELHLADLHVLPERDMVESRLGARQVRPSAGSVSRFAPNKRLRMRLTRAVAGAQISRSAQ